MGDGVGVVVAAGFSIWVVEGVGRVVGDGVGVVVTGVGRVGVGIGVGWVEGWGVGLGGGLFRLLLGSRSFLVWPCCLAGLGVGVVMGVGVGSLMGGEHRWGHW